MEPNERYQFLQQVADFIGKLEIPSVRHPGFSTRCVAAAGRSGDSGDGTAAMPLYMCSTFKQDELNVPRSTHVYSRVSNPSHDAFEKCMAAAEYGKHCRSFASGTAAIFAVFSLLRPGDHVLVCDEVYGGTTNMLNEVLAPNCLLQVEFVNMKDPELVRKAIRAETRLVWLETPSNPLLTIIDVEAIAAIAKERGVLVGIDNTFASPYLQSPLLLGVDVVVHSVTKYVGGHCDIVSGALVTNDDHLFARLCKLSWVQGNNSNPMNSFLAARGIKTIKIRMDQQCRSAFIVAHWLRTHPRVHKVYFPGFEDHPNHLVAKKQMRGFGGMVSFTIAGTEADAKMFFKRVQIFAIGFSLGGVGSLTQHPATMTHNMLSKSQREEIGITDNLIRLSIGLEDVEDLLVDLAQALKLNIQGPK